MNLGESIRHGTQWLVAGGVGSQVINFAVGIVLARLLVPEDFGLLVTVQILTGFVGMIASAGMGEATVQAREVHERDYQTLFTVQLALGVLIYSGFYLIAPGFARYFGNPIYEPLLQASALSFLIRPFSANPGVRLRRAMRFKETAIISFLSLIFTSALSIALAWSGHGVWSLVWSGLAGAVLSAVLLSTRAPWRPVLHFDRESARRLGGYGAKNVLNEVLVYFRAQVPNFFIARLLGPHAVGLFNKADSLSRMPLGLLGGSAYQTVFRAMAKVQDDPEKSRYLYFRTLTLLAFYCFPIYLTLAFAAEPFIVGLYGSSWQDAALPLLVLCGAAPFGVLEMVSGALVAAHARLGRESVLQAQMLVAMVGAAFLFTTFGIVWVAALVVVAAAVHGLRLTRLALSIMGARWSDVLRALAPASRLCVPQAVALALMALALAAAGAVHPLIRLFCLVAAGIGVYGLFTLFWPPAPLIGEANRWRQVLRLTPLSG